jgi:AAA15 family ATPase/GTPase
VDISQIGHFSKHILPTERTDMKLKQFRITNFRSINDSGDIDASRITALLGRNESGKSNLLRALHSLNPASGFVALNPIKDFPRHRRLTDCTDLTPVVKSTWELSEAEKSELADIWPNSSGVSEVTVGRSYSSDCRTIGIQAPEREFSHEGITTKAKKIVAAVKGKAAALPDGVKTALGLAADKFESDVFPAEDDTVWAKAANLAIATLRQSLEANDLELNDIQDGHITELERLSEEIPKDEVNRKEARAWVISKLPVFMFLEDYPELEGQQDVAAFLQRRASNTRTKADENFEKLCKVAGLNPEQLQELSQSGNQETRSQLANRAGSVVTEAIRKRWKDRELKVHFNLDGQHFETLISDPNSTYDVEVNLDERSRGLQWFFAFYIVFAADTDGGDASNAILLLDEPGLYLHAKSQSDLLKHLEDDFTNQILFTTHSPFMVPTHHLDWVRTVSIAEEVGTTVSNDPTGDAKTLFPLQAALGYDLAQSMFVGPHNLIVEGVTDFWVISAVSEHLNDLSGKGLHPKLTITPAGGAQKVHYMVALLTSENLNVIVLLDEEKDAKTTRDDLVKGKLIRDDNVLFVSSAFETDAPKEADIEDVIDPVTYEALVRECYKAELRGKTLELNTHVPRIAKRVELAFKELDIDFHKTRPTRLLLRKIAESAETILTKESLDRFEKLFQTINDAFEKQAERRGSM